MRKVARLILLTILIVLPSFSSFSDTKKSPENSTVPEWADKVQEITLSNGMKFLLYPRGETPIFSAYIRFRVGGLDEELGKTGLAHFLEHMAFKGTKTLGTTDFLKEKPILDEIERVGEELSNEYGKGNQTDQQKIKTLRDKLRSLHQEEMKYLNKEDLAKQMLANGGSDYNATTSKDITSYFVSLPSDKLRFWAEIESHRIFEPVFREFYEEKDVVLEERRMRVDNDPDGRLYEAFTGTAFVKSPYHWPTIGSEDDLRRLTVNDLRKFWERFYDPSNAVGVLVGKLNPEDVRRVLEDTFGRIASSKKDKIPPDSDYPQEPVQTEERRVVLKLEAQPRLFIGYHKPTLPHEDDYIFDLLNQILGEGRSSRLYRKLVIEKKLASEVGTAPNIPGSRLPNLFMIQVSPLPGHSADEIVKVIDDEIARIQTEGVTPGELQKAKNQLTLSLLWEMKTNEGMASQLSYYEITAGSWRYLADYLTRVNRFQTEDLKRVAENYLKTTNRTVGILKP